MPDFSAPFVVEGSVRLPGLGLLVLPATPTPDWLSSYALHTAVAVIIPVITTSSQPISGTIEEIARDGQLTQRALLLDFDPDTTLATGILLQVSEASFYLF
jgi:hypothetical protein